MFLDTYDTDTTANYTKVSFNNPWSPPMTMSYAAPEQALRFSGNEQSFWYANNLSGAYDGIVSALVNFETLGTPDGNGNGLGVSVGLRVDPSGSLDHWGVWGGLWQISGVRYAVIGDGATLGPTVQGLAKIPYSYQEGQTYDLRLDIVGSSATLYVNGQMEVQTNGITQPSSGKGTTGVWVADGASWSSPSSFLVDDWRVEAFDQPAVIPAPNAILLGSIGMSLVNWLRRRRTI